MWTRATHFVVCTFLAASLAFVAGCGGSSGGDSNAVDQPVPVGGNNATGPADPVQDALLGVGGQLGAAPVVGDTAEALIAALVALLDVPDGLAGGFEQFLMTQDPEALLDGGEISGDALLSFSAGLVETIEQLTEEGKALPGGELLTSLLLDLERQVQEGITGESEGGNLTAVTDLLVQIANLLHGISRQVPEQVESAPLVGDLLSALSGALLDISDLFDAVGRLEGDEASAALVGTLEEVVSELAGSLPGGAGGALADAGEQAAALFAGGLGLLLDPLFQVLRGVLAPLTGDESPFGNLLVALLSVDLDALGGLSGFADTIEGGGTAPGGGQIPLLSDLLAGLPLLGDLLAGLLGGNAAGGLTTLDNVVANGGSGGVPLLGDLLQGLPDLSQPGSSEDISLPLLGDLLTTLLALDGDGVPVIGSILSAGGDGSGGLDLPLIGDLLDALLGDLLGLAGGIDSTGGFLDGLGGIPVLGPLLEGLLDGLLGGLLGGG